MMDDGYFREGRGCVSGILFLGLQKDLDVLRIYEFKTDF